MTDTLLPQSAEKSEKLAFVELHRPGVMLGDYQISVKQTVKAGDTEESFGSTNSFSIAGSRFDLSPGDIHAQFPPANSRGDYSNVLPHITFTRSTLPWEREIWVERSSNPEGSSPPPWLALLVIHEPEKQDGRVLPLKTCSLKDLKTDDPQGKIWFLDQNLEETTTATQCKTWFPRFNLEKSQQDDDKVTVLDIRKELLMAILPTVHELNYLAHARQSYLGAQSDGELSNELSVVISNRLPLPGGTTTIYLVSLEDRFKDDGSFYSGSCGDDDYVRLISLKSYDFSCLESRYSFRGLLTHLDQQLLRLPSKGAQNALEPYLAKGYVPLPHHFRKGDRRISWYHSPLIPQQDSGDLEAFKSEHNLSQRPRVADQLLRYHEQTELLDTTYACAWELGRMLSLQDKRLSLGLFKWKQSKSQAMRKNQQSRSDDHLKIDEYFDELPVPQELVDWFQQLSLLQGVPFNYLVPDDRLLPLESIRLFWVDPIWVDWLLDGAFSIGRATGADSTKDNVEQVLQNRNQKVTGFLLHSEIVAGFPDLLVTGYDLPLNSDNQNSVHLPTKNKLTILRRERLSENILLCLFEGEVKTIDLSLKPEALHFGLAVGDKFGNATDDLIISKDANSSKSEIASPHATFYKHLKDITGCESATLKLNTIPWRQNQTVIDIAQLVESIKKIKAVDRELFTSAQFALQMVEGVDQVRFCGLP